MKYIPESLIAYFILIGWLVTIIVGCIVAYHFIVKYW